MTMFTVEQDAEIILAKVFNFIMIIILVFVGLILATLSEKLAANVDYLIQESPSLWDTSGVPIIALMYTL